MLYFIIALASLLIGVVSTLIFLHYRKKAIGTIRIDTSDPSEPPYLFLELDVPIAAFFDKKEVVCKVNNKSYISHE